MRQTFTMFLPDGTPCRATCTVKVGLPPNLAPARLASEVARATARGNHPGVVIVALGDGSVRNASTPQLNITDLEFLRNRAGRVGPSQTAPGIAGALFVNFAETPHAERAMFFRQVEQQSAASNLIRQITLVQDMATGGYDPSPSKLATASHKVLPPGGATRSAAQYSFRNAWPSKISGPQVHTQAQSPVRTYHLNDCYPIFYSSASTSGAVMQWKLTSAAPMKFVGPDLNARGGTDVAMEEITLVYEHIDID